MSVAGPASGSVSRFRIAALAMLAVAAAATVADAAITATEILGRPTATSVTLNAVGDETLEAWVEYGTAPGVYSGGTPVGTFPVGVPIEIAVGGLLPDTRYWYRLRYRVPGAPVFDAQGEHSFHTQRAAGRPFTFAIQADSHLDASTNVDVYQRTLANVAADAPDFFVDLGDTFMSEKFAGSYADTVALHLKQRPYFGTVSHSAPLMLVLGNHEGELGWLLDGTPDNVAVWATAVRKIYYPNPVPDGFYTGDTSVDPEVGQREGYYAWTWGDALFVVLDPFWNTTTKPGQSGDNWDWTLGRPQYDWLVQTLTTSRARFKFVFLHHLLGGTNTEGRGGIAAAPYYEWGGRNGDGTWGFDAHRPGWGSPVHQLLVENGVDVVFHGHDHLFVKEDLDGVVYQEVPQPSHPALNATGSAAGYGYTTGTVISSSGHLRVAVSASEATVEYVRAYLPASETPTRHNGDVAYRYILTPDADVDGTPDADDTCSTLVFAGSPANPPDQNPKAFRLSLRNLDDGTGAIDLRAKGGFSPASTVPAVDPAAHGVQVRLEDGAGVLLDVSVPGGAEGSSPCDAGDGWSIVQSATVTKWMYRNVSGGLPDGAGACTAGAAAGIRSILVTRKSMAAGPVYLFRVAMADGALLDLPALPVSRIRFDLVLGAAPSSGGASAQSIAGQCAEFQLDGSPVPGGPLKPWCKGMPSSGPLSSLRCAGL